MSGLLTHLHAVFHQPDSRMYHHVQGLVRALISGTHHNVYIGMIPGDPKETVPFGDIPAAMALSERGGLVVSLPMPS